MMVRGKCFKCRVTASPLREQSCWTQCVINEGNPEEAARLRDFKPLNSDGVDYTGTDHPRWARIEGEREDWSPMPGWADIVSGKCKCIQCEYARFKHNIKQMIIKEKQRMQNG